MRPVAELYCEGNDRVDKLDCFLLWYGGSTAALEVVIAVETTIIASS